MGRVTTLLSLWLSVVSSGFTAGTRLESTARVQKSHRDSSIKQDIPSLCETHWIAQTIDHFNGKRPPSGEDTYQMRYLVCDKHRSGPDGPIFFYTGNEGDVMLYVNNSGLMWENAEQFGAVLVFAEHRYYGQSIPAPAEDRRYLSHEQALADYTHLIATFREEHNAHNAPVIAFGGSYGGMLSAWFRLKYPHVVDGSIASSAPIAGFEKDWDRGSYWKQMTHDTSPAGGSCTECADNVRASWPLMDRLAATKSGLEALSTIFRTCSPLTDMAEVNRMKLYLALSWDTMAMGNFPYPSSYLAEGKADLPTFPVRVACSHLCDPDLRNEGNEAELLRKANAAVNVFRNASQDVLCMKVPETMMETIVWDYQYCTELLCEETYYTMDGVADMFYPYGQTREQITKHCLDTHGVIPRFDWIRESYGSLAEIARYGSNIVFANGDLDTWISAGVTQSLSPTLPALLVKDGAHHLDLMFSHESDNDSVKQVRDVQVQHIQRWIDERMEANQQQLN